MEINGIKVGYNYDEHGIFMTGAYLPTFEPITGDWFTHSPSPVADVNAGGQVVGVSEWNFSSKPSYAAFSSVTGRPHEQGLFANEVDNLNNYIPALPGVSLNSAVKIDDRGRILATGTDSHVYLLTPLELGSPAPVPEPTTLMLFGVATAGLWVRLRLRRGTALSG